MSASLVSDGTVGIHVDTPTTLLLDGYSLTLEDFMSLESRNISIDLTPESWKKVAEGRKVIDDIVESGQRVYGINTGFGSFSTVPIDAEKLVILQENLIRSHAAGVGQPLPPIRTRRLLALRINVLSKGFSGIRVETLKTLIEACNKWCLPFVPEKGTLGASGDLAPLSHLALGMMGEGQMWDFEGNKWASAAQILERHGITPIKLQAKEGLAMINGTQLIVGIGAEALYRAERLCVVADVAGAMSLEALKGTCKAFDPDIHRVRPHTGQIQCAQRLLKLLQPNGKPSEISTGHANCGAVQDSYTLRCMPQVHGISSDTVQFVKNIILTEMNSATDNPMVFAESGKIISGGNFHGEYPAKSMDYLSIGIHELASISERRIERLVNHALSPHLPAFLVAEGGLNSGFMIAHCTSAALVSENKAKCFPSSVDSISTSAAKEDHVSMGGWAARKALEIVENVENVLAIELLAATQGILYDRPLKTSEPLERVIRLIREHVAPWESDRYMAPDIQFVWKMILTGKISDLVKADIQ
eukprot:TRINITY_DN12702_c0_g1_i1.p1 TRINITY_DN12702_c0_g1~~TRINITY_DN12702_c0_g1_i1.p1  ORF type:complete len:531 (+),score=111.70 TRINITY_DN12702_c0_g1_i1:1863-3455(+)